MSSLRSFKHVVLLIALLTVLQMLSPTVKQFAGRYSPQLLHTFSPTRRNMSSFRLDPIIFNAALYKQITDVWLPGIDMKGRELDQDVLKRWFMPTPEQRREFDAICKNNFGRALESIGPDTLAEPSAQPFLDEIKRVDQADANGDGSAAASTALSLVLLLDQMPRNIYRTSAGLRLVYNHYDSMAYALARNLLSSNPIIPRADLHPQWRHSAAHRLWFYLPLTHSEKIEAHDLLSALMDAQKKEAEQIEGIEASRKMIEGGMKSEAEHREILDNFGRYPHRNAALGRESTDDEKKFLQEGGKTFGVTVDEE